MGTTDPSIEERLRRAWARRREAFELPADEQRAELSSVLSELESVTRDVDPIRSAVAHAHTLHLQAHVQQDLGELETAEQLWGRSVEILRQAGDPVALAHKVRHLGDARRARGTFEAAREPYVEALALYRDHGDPTGLDLANAVNRMADIEERLGAHDAARGLYARLGIDAGVAEADRHLEDLGRPAADHQQEDDSCTD